jgi:hypothetical protein
MKFYIALAAGTLGSLISSSAFADDTSLTAPAAAPKLTIGAQVELLPLGSGKITFDGDSESRDTAVAYGISGTLEYAVTPYLGIGVSPRLVLHVTDKDGDDDAADADASKQIDLRARIRAHYPVTPGLEVYAALTPGYTIITSTVDEVSNSNGFAIGGAVGATYDISPRLFISGEVGYQRAFTSNDTELAGQKLSSDLEMSYMHVGLGAGTRF